MTMLDQEVRRAIELWPSMANFVFVPHTEEEYKYVVSLLEDENHRLASLMELLGTLIEKYEEEHIPELTD